MSVRLYMPANCHKAAPHRAQKIYRHMIGHDSHADDLRAQSTPRRCDQFGRLGGAIVVCGATADCVQTSKVGLAERGEIHKSPQRPGHCHANAGL
eukprot:366532-Chlamydomonas_euryale.AAC.6